MAGMDGYNGSVATEQRLRLSSCRLAGDPRRPSFSQVAPVYYSLTLTLTSRPARRPASTGRRGVGGFLACLATVKSRLRLARRGRSYRFVGERDRDGERSG